MLLLDFFRWGHLKSVVSMQRPRNIKKLKQRIRMECSKISVNVLRNVHVSCVRWIQKCHEVNGQQFDHFRWVFLLIYVLSKITMCYHIYCDFYLLVHEKIFSRKNKWPLYSLLVCVCLSVCLSVCMSVCLSVCPEHSSVGFDPILTKFWWEVYNMI